MNVLMETKRKPILELLNTNCKLFFTKYVQLTILIILIIILIYQLHLYVDHQNKISRLQNNYGKSLNKNKNNNIYEIVKLGDENRTNTSYVTLVFAQFKFKKSKHSIESYENWSDVMMKSFGSPFVAFVDYNWSEKFIKKIQELNLTGREIFFYLN